MKESMNPRHLKRSHVLQQDQSDCGVACLLSLIQYYGGENSLENLRVMSGTGREGTTLLGLYEAAQKTGFTAEGCEADMEALMEHGEPVILHLKLENNLQHYVVCYGYESSRFLIGDPGKGIVYYSVEDLEKAWISGCCLVLSPSGDFVSGKNIKKQKMQWLWFLLQKDVNLLVMAMVIGVVVSLLGLTMSLFSQKLIDDILPTQNNEKLFIGLLLLSALLLLRILVVALRQFLLNRQTKDFNERLIQDFFSKLMHLPVSFFDTRKIGDFTARLNDSARIQRVLSLLLSSLMIDALVVVISLSVLFGYHWQIGLFCLLCLPVLWVLISRFHQPVLALQKETMQQYALTESNYIDTIQGIAEIKNARKEDYFSAKNQKVYSLYQQKILELSHLNLRLNLLAGIGSVIFLVGILLLASYQVMEEVLLIGQLMAVIGIASNLLPSALNIALLLIPINEAKVAFDRVFEFSTIPDADTQQNETVFKENLQSITIADVSFRFPGRSPLLKEVDLLLEKGKLTILKGESGSGKSTLLSILNRNYPFQSGNIYLNEAIPLQNISNEEWKEKVAFVPQQIKIFNCSLLENILMESPDEENSASVILFCGQLGFDSYFSQLPDGYFTVLGESGIHLSGGQKQLLALARALYQRPQLLLLDESTSAMDKNTERFVLDLLQKIKSEMIIFFISHKESLIQEVDAAYLLENKSIKEYVLID